MVVDQEAVAVSPVSGRRRARQRDVLYNWVAHSPDDCLGDLHVLCQEMKDGLRARYDDVVPQIIKDLAKCFDLESLISGPCAFHFEDGNLGIELKKRQIWGLIGDAEFANFFKTVCQLPHVQQLLEKCPDLDLLPHSSGIVYRKLKNTLRAMV